MAEVLMYRTRWCPYCFRAARLLEAKGVPYAEVDVSSDPERRRWLVEVSGQRTVPQIFINGSPIGGFDELWALERAGQLDVLLSEAPPAADRGGDAP